MRQVHENWFNGRREGRRGCRILAGVCDEYLAIFVIYLPILHREDNESLASRSKRCPHRHPGESRDPFVRYPDVGAMDPGFRRDDDNTLFFQIKPGKPYD
jgi:hypothetical protein